MFQTRTLDQILDYSEATYRAIVGFPKLGTVDHDMEINCSAIPYGESVDSAERYGSALTTIYYRANGHSTFKNFMWIGANSHHNDFAKSERYMRDIAAGIA